MKYTNKSGCYSIHRGAFMYRKERSFCYAKYFNPWASIVSKITDLNSMANPSSLFSLPFLPPLKRECLTNAPPKSTVPPLGVERGGERGLHLRPFRTSPDRCACSRQKHRGASASVTTRADPRNGEERSAGGSRRNEFSQVVGYPRELFISRRWKAG